MAHELMECEAKNPRLKVKFILTRNNGKPAKFEYSEKRITKEILEENMPKPGDDTLLLFCGPKPMNLELKEIFKDMGYPVDDFVKL